LTAFTTKKEGFAMVDIKKLAEENGFNPVYIGKAVLEKLGYKVSLVGFAYNSLAVRVYSPDGELVFEELIGE